MSIETQILNLKHLASLDAELSRLTAELDQERSAIEARRARKDEVTARAASLEESVQEMERTRHELQSEARQVALQVDKAREKLTRCRNEREANAASRELEELRRIHREREKEVEKLQGLIADARADVQKATEGRDALLMELGETADAQKTRLAVLEEESSAKAAERAEASMNVEKSVLRRYDAVRQRRGSGLSQIVDGTCVACHISISPMLFQQIARQQELFNCPSCHRILYYVSPGQTSELAGAGGEES